MGKNSRKLLNGKTTELKGEFLDIAGRLPENWISTYVDTFCMNLRGMALVNKYQRLQNIKTLKSTPEPSEMKNIRKLLETNKEKQLQAS